MNNTRDIDSKLIESNVDCSSSEGSVFIKRYCEVKLFVHLHYRLRRARTTKIDFNEYCASFNYARRSNQMGVNSSPRGDPCDVESDGVSRPGRDMNVPMFVEVRHLSKNPEGIIRETFIPSVVRLQTLNDCLRVWREAPDLVKRRPVPSVGSVESLRIIPDGKLGCAVVSELVGASAVGDGENDMVERRAQVLDNVSYDCPPSEKRWLSLEDNPSPERAPNEAIYTTWGLPFNVEFVDDFITVRLKESDEFLIERLQVLVRSV